MRCPDGYTADTLVARAIRAGLETSFLGRTILYAPSTVSTNEDAKSLGSDYPEGTVFLAGTQSGGKGRIGRQWSSPPGGVFMSAVLRPAISPERIPALSLVAGYCVAAEVRDAVGLDALLKWPNDVLVDNRKVCGILCEMRSGSSRLAEVVVGIGVNANVDACDLPDTAASLKSLAGRDVDVRGLIAGILNRFEVSYLGFLEHGLSHLEPGIQELCAFLDEIVVVRNMTAADQLETQGIFRGIDREGRALVEIPGGETRAFSAGDLSLRVL